MSAIVVAKDDAEKPESPMHINVTDLTFGYVGREVRIVPAIYKIMTENIFWNMSNSLFSAGPALFEYATNKWSQMFVNWR